MNLPKSRESRPGDETIVLWTHASRAPAVKTDLMMNGGLYQHTRVVLYMYQTH